MTDISDNLDQFTDPELLAIETEIAFHRIARAARLMTPEQREQWLKDHCDTITGDFGTTHVVKGRLCKTT